jgi:hypothetical protein
LDLPLIYRLFVPYTDQVLDLDDNGGWANGIKVQAYNDLGEKQISHQWIFNSGVCIQVVRSYRATVLPRANSDLAFDPPVKAGEVYKIINCHTGTVVQLEDSNNGAFVSVVPRLKYSLTFVVPCHSISCWVQL